MDKSNAQRVLILSEAGLDIGFGHYTRCSAIQAYLNAHGVDCKMLLNVVGDYQLDIEPESVVDWLSSRNVVNDLSAHYQTVLIDSYIATEQAYSWLSNTFEKIIAIDDYNRIAYDADMLINPNVFFDSLDYSNQSSSKIFGGKEYVILRKVFRTKDKKKKSLAKIISKITITVGGTDYRNILPLLINIVSKNKWIHLTVITGNVKLQAFLQNQFKDINILGLLTASEMYACFNEADIVISACGQTLHELASLGKPTIGICLDIDQVPNQQFYFEKRFLKTKIHYDNLSEIQAQIILLTNLEIRAEIQQLGPSIINKYGIGNIGKLLMN